MSIRGIMILVGVLGLSYVGIKMQVLGTKVTNQTALISRQNKQLADTTRLLKMNRVQIRRLGKRVGNLLLDSLTKSGQIIQLKLDKEKAQGRSSELLLGFNRVQLQIRQGVNTKTAQQKKEAADRVVSGVGVVNTTVEQEELNGQIATLKAENLNYSDVIVPGLTEANGILSQKVSSYEERESELEKALNRKDGYIGDLRIDVQNRRQKASKGVVKRVFNAGKIKQLGEIEAAISTIQEKP